jgi:hypothetical protein
MDLGAPLGYSRRMFGRTKRQKEQSRQQKKQEKASKMADRKKNKSENPSGNVDHTTVDYSTFTEDEAPAAPGRR